MKRRKAVEGMAYSSSGSCAGSGSGSGGSGIDNMVPPPIIVAPKLGAGARSPSSSPAPAFPPIPPLALLAFPDPVSTTQS